MARRGGQRRGKGKGKGKGKPATGRRRAGAAARYMLLGLMFHIAYDRDADLRELLRLNRRKVGAPFRLSLTMAVAVAVSRDLSHSSYRRIAGSLADATRGACCVTYSQICRRVNALDLGDVEWYVRRRGIRIVREGGERVRVTADQHGGISVLSRRNRSRITVVAHGQYRVTQVASRMARASAVLFDGTGLAVRAADAHRGITHEGGIRKRKHRKASVAFALGPADRVGFAAVALGPENAADAPAFVPLARAARACGALGRGTDAIADKAYATRENVAWCAANGVDPVIPVRITSSGKSHGTPGWRRLVVDNLAPPGMRRRLMRGGDVQSLRREDLVAAQELWMARKHYHRRQAVEGAFASLKQIFRGDIMAQNDDNASSELARKAIIYNAACK